MVLFILRKQTKLGLIKNTKRSRCWKKKKKKSHIHQI